jgi:transposase
MKIKSQSLYKLILTSSLAGTFPVSAELLQDWVSNYESRGISVGCGHKTHFLTAEQVAIYKGVSRQKSITVSGSDTMHTQQLNRVIHTSKIVNSRIIVTDSISEKGVTCVALSMTQ